MERVSYGSSEYDDYSDAVKNYVDTLPNDDSPHICIMTFQSRYLIFAQKYLSGNYSSAFVISYALNSPGYFYKTEGTWKDGL